MSAPLPGVTTRPAGPADEAAIQELFEATFGVRRSDEEWRWRYLNAPLAPLMHLFELDGQLIGHIAYGRFEAYLDGERQAMVSGGDWMHRPEVRGKGLSRIIGPVAMAFLATVPVSLDFPSADALEAFQRGPNRVHPLGRMPQWVRWRTGRAVHLSNSRIPPTVGRLLAVGTDLAGRLGELISKRHRSISDGWGRPDDLDDLADRLRGVARCVRVRDSAYLVWRWSQQPDREWWMLTCTGPGGRMTGWIVAGLDPSEPRTGRIVDLLAEDAASTTALITAAYKTLSRAGAEVTTCEIVDPRPWVASALRRAGFTARGEGPHAMCGWVLEGNEAWASLDAWYLTRGDTDFA